MITGMSMRTLRKRALAQGWRIEPTRNGHERWLSPSGGTAVISGTPSDHRALLNARADLKRAGLR